MMNSIQNMIEIRLNGGIVTFLFCIYIAIQVSGRAKCIYRIQIFIRRAVSIERKDLKIPFSSPKFCSPPLSLSVLLNVSRHSTERSMFSTASILGPVYSERESHFPKCIHEKRAASSVYMHPIQILPAGHWWKSYKSIFFFFLLCDTHISRCKCDLPVGYISFYHHFEKEMAMSSWYKSTHWLDAAIKFWNSHFSLSQSKGFSLFD